MATDKLEKAAAAITVKATTQIFPNGKVLYIVHNQSTKL